MEGATDLGAGCGSDVLGGECELTAVAADDALGDGVLGAASGFNVPFAPSFSCPLCVEPSFALPPRLNAENLGSL